MRHTIYDHTRDMAFYSLVCHTIFDCVRHMIYDCMGHKYDHMHHTVYDSTGMCNTLYDRCTVQSMTISNIPYMTVCFIQSMTVCVIPSYTYI